MRVLILGAAMTAAACGAANALQGPPVSLEVLVAKQQSASASLLQADGTMKHVQVGDGPHEAAVSPDGRIAVVTIYGVGSAPGNQLAVIDLERDVVTRRIDLGQYTRPHGVVFLGTSPDRVVVTSETTSNVVLVTLSTGAVEVIGTNARGSHMIAVTADGTRGWTANVADNSVSEIDLAGRRFVRSFSVPAQPEGIAVTPDGGFVWVGSNQTGAVTVISTRSGQIATTLNGALPVPAGCGPGRVPLRDCGWAGQQADRGRCADPRSRRRDSTHLAPRCLVLAGQSAGLGDPGWQPGRGGGHPGNESVEDCRGSGLAGWGGRRRP